MMHGVIRPTLELEDQARSRWDRVRAAAYEWRKLLLIVVMPTLLVAAYYYLVAANQYEAEAHFSVSQGSTLSSAMSSGIGELVGLSAASQSQIAADNVSDFLRSHDAVAQLGPRNLTAMFQRPEADFVSRLRKADPSPELLLQYYRHHVLIHVDPDSGLVTLRVRTFRPADSFAMATALIQLGEWQINRINGRSYNDAVSAARQQLNEAEDEGAGVRQRMTSFRQARGDIDPNSTGQAQLKLVADLKAQLVTETGRLESIAEILSPRSPQYQSQAQVVRILRGNIAAQSQALAGGRSAIATNIGSYEDLQGRQDFAKRRYDAAAAALAQARAEARRQQLYLVRVVEPNRPGKSLYPQRGIIVLTVFLTLLIMYSIGWLIAAGVREHAA